MIAYAFTDGSIVRHWRDKIEKYTKLQGICSLHDLVIVMHPIYIWRCYSMILEILRSFRNSEMKLTRGSESTDDAIPKQEDTYIQLGSCHELSTKN